MILYYKNHITLHLRKTLQQFALFMNQIVKTRDFSLQLPVNWEVEVGGLHRRNDFKEYNVQEGTISSTSGRNDLFFCGFVVVQKYAPEKDRIKFKNDTKEFSLKERLVSDNGFIKYIQNSTWHSNLETVELGNGVSVERIDVEYINSTPKRLIKENQPDAICGFKREYHTSSIEMDLYWGVEETCQAARPEFEAIEKSILWKN